MSPKKMVTKNAKKSAFLREDESPVEREPCQQETREKKATVPCNETPEEGCSRELRKTKRNRDNKSNSGSSSQEEIKDIQGTAIKLKLRRLAAQKQRASRLNESEEHRKIRLAKDRERQRLARMKLTPQQKMARLQADRERKVAMRAKETEIAKQKRLKFDRERHIISRLNRSIAETEIPIEYLTADVTITESEVELQAFKSDKFEEPDSTQTIESPKSRVTVPEENKSRVDDENLPTSTNRSNTSDNKSTT